MSAHCLFINQFLSAHDDALFASKAFFSLHNNGTGRFYEWGDGTQPPLISLHFTETQPGHWRNPARGTYAGPVLDGAIGRGDLALFLSAVEKDLSACGMTSMEILLPPSAHTPEHHALIVQALLHTGFATIRTDIDYTIDVTSAPLHTRMRKTQAQRITKCARAGLSACRLAFSNLAEAYDIISHNAKANGFSLSMSPDQLRAMEDAIPGSLCLFGVRNDAGNLAAASICVRIAKDRLYIFMVGDAPDMQAYSPAVMMLDFIYEDCQRTGIVLLDYGTASIGEEINTGLSDFKRRLGFQECEKLRMVKKT